MWVFWLVAGVILAAAFIHVTRRFDTYKAFAIGLVVAACIYVAFALTNGASAGWIALELAGVILYGSIALLGMRHNRVWLAIGWGTHLLWDIGLHLLGQGHSFAPRGYAITCISFDAVLALYIAYRCTRPAALQ